ncbi:hypothetical protein V5N11_002827 [Cardamine amara subsp. amara]|uniref:Reverse transcriptase domain-containing protein n=1 Tax=Cardamine amara subsp. amara TaxID=228776 RepID=A0ABD1C6F5_CARAN
MVPYPNPRKRLKKEKEKAKLKEIIGQLSVRLPFVEACAMFPPFRKYCQINSETFEHSLCDFGSSINMMPLTVANCLGYFNFKPTRISLGLADRSIRKPVGILVDVPIVIFGCEMPTYFVILEFEKEPRDPMILGRPFLSIAGAIIDDPNGKIDLHLGDSIMKFDMNITLRHNMCANRVFTIDDLERTTDGVREALTLEDPMEIALTRNESNHDYLETSVEDCEKILDSAESYDKLGAYLKLYEKITVPVPPKDNP